MGGKAQPHRQAHQDVAQDAAEEGLRDAERDLRLRDRDRGLRHRAAGEPERPRPDDEERCAKRADQVRRIDQVQLRASCPVVICRAAQAMTTRLFPVNSSAPPTTTRISPSENASPASSRPGPKPSGLSVRTSVENMAPNATKAPASRPRARCLYERQGRFLDPDLFDQDGHLSGRVRILGARGDGGRRRLACKGRGRSVHGSGSKGSVRRMIFWSPPDHPILDVDQCVVIEGLPQLALGGKDPDQ